MKGWVTICLMIVVAGTVQVSHAWAEEARAGETIRLLLAETMEGGFRTLDVEKFMSAYAEDAVVGTHMWGLISKARWRKELQRQFQQLDACQEGLTVELAIDSVELEESDALVTASLNVAGQCPSGQTLTRRDPLYLKMDNASGKWLIRRQGYRADFQAPRENSGMHGW